MVWEIEGTDEFADWYGSLAVEDQASNEFSIALLEDGGPALGRPHVDTVYGSRYPNMKELRSQSAGEPIRVFFAFDPRRTAILLIGGNKTGDDRFYRTMIPKLTTFMSSTSERSRSNSMATKPWQQVRADRSKLTPEQQTAVDLRAQSTIARMHLGELRRARAFTQKAIAENSGIAQGEVSKIEHRTDAYVSTLRNFIEAMGGTFRMIAEFPGGDPVEIAGFADLSADARSAKAPTPASATP